MSEPVPEDPEHRDQRQQLVALYDAALGDVYGYLVRRCGSVIVAEELTSETFLAAVARIRRQRVESLTVAWLIGIARHKLVDHWRRAEREQRTLALTDTYVVEDRWDVTLDAIDAHETLAELAPHHRSVLTLRYLDGMPVATVAQHIRRTTGATEVLLVRARRAFRTAHEARRGTEA